MACLAVLFIVALAWPAASTSASGLFPLLLSVEYGRPVSANSTNAAGFVCSFTPKLSSLAPTVMEVVREGDSWQTIANRRIISLQRLLHLNFIFSGDFSVDGGSATLPALVAGTFIIVDRAPSLAPECACPGAFFQLSDDEITCTDPLTSSSVPRLLSSARIASYVTSGLASSFWAPNTTSRTTDLILDLQLLNEIFSVDLSLTRVSGSPAAVQVSALVSSSLPDEDPPNITALGMLKDSSWTTIITFAPALSQRQFCSPSAVCADLMRGLSSSSLPVSADGRAVISTSALRLRFFFTPAETRPIQVWSCVCVCVCVCLCVCVCVCVCVCRCSVHQSSLSPQGSNRFFPPPPHSLSHSSLHQPRAGPSRCGLWSLRLLRPRLIMLVRSCGRSPHLPVRAL
jgi:hypothetical protein